MPRHQSGMASASAYPIHLKVGSKRRNPQGTAVIIIRHIDTQPGGIMETHHLISCRSLGESGGRGTSAFFHSDHNVQ